MSNTKIHIILGCFGYQEDGFVFCNGIENIIFTLNKEMPFYKDAMSYLDTCKLFDQPNYDYNTIRNFLVRFKDKFTFVDKPIWLPRKYENYQKFVLSHKNCGLILKLNSEHIQTNIPIISNINRKLIGR